VAEGVVSGQMVLFAVERRKIDALLEAEIAALN
jgi:hypothetical protein